MHIKNVYAYIKQPNVLKVIIYNTVSTIRTFTQPPSLKPRTILNFLCQYLVLNL